MKADLFVRYIVPVVMALMLVMSGFAAHASPESAGEGKAEDMAIEDTDGGITALVKEQLEQYPNIIVETSQGVVTLSGAVFNKVEHDKVIDMVGRRGDVKGVVDKLTIRNQ